MLTFCDVFAGCGGVSLGLINAGWKGTFAIEHNADAFNTYKTNLISNNKQFFSWPQWLPIEPISITSFLDQYGDNLNNLKGTVDLLAGGPPCQGFSLAGRRTHNDPRNALTDEYLRIVEKLNPRILVFENVQGYTQPFKKNGDEKYKNIPYSFLIIERLERLGYKSFTKIVNLSDYGIPQTRKRFILVGIRENDIALTRLKERTPFDLLETKRKQFLLNKGLSSNTPVSCSDAIGDLEIKKNELIDNDDCHTKGFKKVLYRSSDFTTAFIELMRKDCDSPPNSMRLPNHAPSTVRQFRRIMDTCVSGKAISKEDRTRLGIRKHAITPLNKGLPSSTITTLPDDAIHYSEPRILTVRENARLQTFPDWYVFTGSYTTGGINRKNTCPRYTQVGNAVPPLFAEALGLVLVNLASREVSYD